MTPDRALHVIQSITYKPGWTITAHVKFWGGPPSDSTLQSVVVDFRLRAPDAYGGGWVPLALRRTICEAAVASMEDADLVAMVFSFIVDAEVHEAEEWFKVAGHRVRDPHPRQEARS
jgi:hypothetical protein